MPAGTRTKNAVLFASVAVSVGVIVLTGIWRSQAARDIATVVNRNCQSIEALKKQFRQQAIENYERLDVNAKLLGVTVTPELREAAKVGRDRTLRRFAHTECKPI